MTSLLAALAGTAAAPNLDRARTHSPSTSPTVPLDHTTFDRLPGRTTEYLHGLLVEHGCLPSRDRYLAAFENWLPTKLDQITDPGARRHLDAFARWHLLRQLRDRAKREPIPAGAFLNAKQSSTVAIDFLGWLAGRGQQLETATQADLDACYAGGPSTRSHAARFLSWARGQHLTRIDQPRLKREVGPIMSEGDRLDQLNRLLDDHDLLVTPRLIGLLVLMFGQPLSRIVRLPRPGDRHRRSDESASRSPRDRPATRGCGGCS